MSKAFQSLGGQLLLDGGNLKGSFFQRTVVLVCQHDPDGAFGLVLNKSTDTTVGSVVAADLPEDLRGQTLFLGGPVQPSALSFLHAGSGILDANVIDNLRLGHSLDDLVDASTSLAPDNQVRVFAGYSGWGPGQLDDEMSREAWITHPASLPLVFQADPTALWQQILKRKGWRYRLLATQPEDLSAN